MSGITMALQETHSTQQLYDHDYYRDRYIRQVSYLV